MATEIKATFNPDDVWVPIEEGTYPAHIASLSTKEVNTRAGEAIVVNMTYKVADEAADIDQLMWKMDGYNYVMDNSGGKVPVTNGKGKQATSKCKHLVGRTFYDNGWFIFSQGSSSGKNKRYFDLLNTLGVELQEEDIDGETVKKLVLLEESDVVGKPVQVTIKKQEYITKDTQHLPKDQQEKRSSFKVNTLELWSDGEQLSQDEMDDDVPF